MFAGLMGLDCHSKSLLHRCEVMEGKTQLVSSTGVFHINQTIISATVMLLKRLVLKSSALHFEITLKKIRGEELRVLTEGRDGI